MHLKLLIFVKIRIRSLVKVFVFIFSDNTEEVKGLIAKVKVHLD